MALLKRLRQRKFAITASYGIFEAVAGVRSEGLIVVRIESIRVANYKSFADSGEIRFVPGFNVIVGRNNVGKTALAEATSLRFPGKPHRSLNTVPTFGTPIDKNSRAEISIRLEANELVDLLIREMPTFYVSTDVENPMISGQAKLSTALSEGATINATFLNGGHHSAQLSTYGGPTPPEIYLRFTMDSSGNPSVTGPIHRLTSDFPELAAGLAIRFHERLYSFSAVRFGIDENPISTNRILAPDASNLVQVLDLLSRNPSRWQRYFEHVRMVLPEIEAITFVPTEGAGGIVRAQLWNISLDTERGFGCTTLRERYRRWTGASDPLRGLRLRTPQDHRYR